MSRKTELTRRNILKENDLIEIEMMTAKLSNVRTNNILMVHQMNKVSHQRSLYEFGRWNEWYLRFCNYCIIFRIL
jgi:hypothetical protein